MAFCIRVTLILQSPFLFRRTESSLLTRSAEVWTHLYELNTYDVLVDRVARERPDEHSHQDDDVGKVGAGGDKQAVEVIGLECVVVEEETDDGQDLWERERERKKIELNIR